MLITIFISTTFAVNSSVDAPDANIGDGICATSTGECTLRAAVDEANALLGMDTITFLVPSVSLDATVYVYDSLYLWGSSTVDSIYCTSFVGDCIFAASYLKLRRIYMRSLKTTVSSWCHLDATNFYADADTFAIYSSDGKLEVRNSELYSRNWGIVSFHDTFVVIRNSTISTGDMAIQYYTDGVLAPDSIVYNTINSDHMCIMLTMNGKNSIIRNNTLYCVQNGIMVNDEPTNVAVPESVFVDSNDVYIYGRGVGAIRLDGCIGCSVGRNRLLGTDTSGYFIYLANTRNSVVWYNTNLDNTLYTDAGRYSFITLENSDSNIVKHNRWDFSYLKDSTSGIQLLAGSDYNIVDSNYVGNFLWGGIAVFDSSSYNRFYGDSVVYTAGIQLRPHWKGRYSFPFYLDTTYSGAVGTGNLFRHVYSYGIYTAMAVAGMDSTVVDSSIMETADIWGNAITNAGSELYVYNSTLRGASTVTDTGGYGISLEYFYWIHAIASEYADDSLFHIFVENTTFENLAFGFRVMDIDTSYIKLDTIFDATNNNTLTGYTYGYYGDYFLPVVVQTLDLSCNPTILAIDSVRIFDTWGGYTTLGKVNTGEALWSFHWEPVSTVYYDSLNMWYPVRILYYDNLGNIGTPNPYTVTLYGENGNTLSTTLDVERGLVSYTDPCPTAGYPKTVDNRWLVIKFQYDPGYLPVSNPEERGEFRLVIGRYQIPVSAGEVVRVFSPSGRIVKVLRVEGDARIDLQPGLYLVKVSDKTYRIPVF